MVVSFFGTVAVAIMVVAYALEGRSSRFVLVFALASVAASAYALMIAAWPFAALEAIWAGVAARRWWRLGTGGSPG